MAGLGPRRVTTISGGADINRGKDDENEGMESDHQHGQKAVLESGLEQQEVQKPTHISARDFIHWLAAGSHINDDSLSSLFKL